jgi:hypothetical protein
MKALEIKGDLNIIKGKLKQKRAKLTGDKLQDAKGKSEELLEGSGSRGFGSGSIRFASINQKMLVSFRSNLANKVFL